MSELAEFLGEDALLELAREMGGKRVYIPKQVTPAHPIARILGLEKAERLALRCGGCRYHIPTARSASRDQRRRRVAELKSRGWSTLRVAEDLGLSERQVWRLIADSKRSG